MASRVLKLFNQYSQQTHSYMQLIPEYLSGRKMSLYYLTSASRYSTSNPQLLNKKDLVSSNAKVQKNIEGSEKKASHILLQEKGFIPIYKMQFAPFFGAVNKVKWHQLYLSSGCVTLSFLCSSAGIFPTSVTFAVIYVGGIVTSTLWIFTAIFSRVVGAILVSPDGETICISYVDNKGRRQDDVFPVTELVPLSDLPRQKFTSLWWVSLQRYSAPEYEYKPYKMFVHNYDILDKKKFMEVFRSLL